MTDSHKRTEAEVIADLDRKIVKVSYSTDSDLAPKDQKAVISTGKILELARKIRETYDYSDISLNGTHGTA